MSKNHQTEIFTVLYKVSFNLFYVTPAQKSSFPLKENASLFRATRNEPTFEFRPSTFETQFDSANTLQYKVYKKESKPLKFKLSAICCIN